MANAGTVTLTGTCLSNPSNNTLVFSIINSGNEAGQNLGVSLHILGVNYAPKQYSIGTLRPGATNTISISLASLYQQGSLPAYLLVNYLQDGYTYYAAFPCQANLASTTLSNIKITSSVASIRSNESEITADITNTGNSTINANIALILPPIFSYNRNLTQHVMLGPHATSTTAFKISYSPGNVSAGGSVAAYYVMNGLYYSTLAPLAVSTAHTNTGIMNYWPFLAVIILTLFIALRTYLLRNKRVKIGSRNTIQGK
ncbi:MAG: hypothetical protein KGH64_05940 [Candidatus Micrarchaeota archaeon]|nr:hypothetical protein [Candidatus Micrarchaeota archaeon]